MDYFFKYFIGMVLVVCILSSCTYDVIDSSDLSGSARAENVGYQTVAESYVNQEVI